MSEKTVTAGRIWPLIGIALVALVGFFTLRDVLSFDTLREHRETLLAWRDGHYLLAALGFIGAYVAVVAFSLPGAAVMTLAGGFLFGIFPGALFCVIGATLGAVAIFLAAKTGLGDALHARLQDRPGLVNRMEAGLRENEISYLLLMRFVPVIPFFLANLAPAFLGVGLRNFAITTFFGIMPGSVVYTSVGSGLGAVFERGETPDLGIIFAPHILGPILGLCALAALPIVLKRFVKKKDIA
ncbi:TVP38/TMEM64 family protein [Neptunicoccus sediminis]|uniref:TVP38/TMEM64 family protein n=1 Tax=Neptunicoccus sediminis TaxID=1892596 RepID=UPI000846070E|nr:TVP38/TMEM64 family protein [Neptunicoccus sediminis]